MSPCRYPIWCFRLNCVEKSPWPHLRRSFPFACLYRLQSTTTRCVFMRTIQPIQLNGSIQHEALKTAGATPFCLSFQCIKLPPVMTSHANYDVLHSFPLIRNWSIVLNVDPLVVQEWWSCPHTIHNVDTRGVFNTCTVMSCDYLTFY